MQRADKFLFSGSNNYSFLSVSKYFTTHQCPQPTLENSIHFIYKDHGDLFQISLFWEFPGGPVVRTRHFHCRGLGSILGRGTKIPQAARRGRKNQKKTNTALLMPFPLW